MPSFTQWSNDIDRLHVPNPNVTCVCKIYSYTVPIGELASIIAITAHSKSNNPPADSCLKNHKKACITCYVFLFACLYMFFSLYDQPYFYIFCIICIVLVLSIPCPPFISAVSVHAKTASTSIYYAIEIVLYDNLFSDKFLTTKKLLFHC